METLDSSKVANLSQNASKRKKKSAARYTDAILKEALDAVKKGMPVSTASKEYNIPRTTLQYKNWGKSPPVIKSRGPECILGEEYERQLVQWIFYMSQNGFPVSRVQLLDSVQLLLKQIKTTTTFTDNRPGRHWYDAFRARHKNVTERMSQNLTHSRAKVTEDKLRAWFNEVRIYFESKSLLDIDPSRVFNCDESAFFLSPKGSKALVKKGDKTVYNFINNDEKECLTTLICGSASGKIASPMVIFSYKRIPGHIARSMPKDWSIGHSENGWMTGETFYEYIANIFYPWLVKNAIMFPVVLFLDGHSSHLTMALSNFCREKEIELIALYPNATHILQPLDVAFFHSLKTAWAKVVGQWRLENNGERIKRENFAQLLQKALDMLDVKTILKNGFEKTGLHPFSADGINYQKYFKNSVDYATPQTTPSERIRTELEDYLAFIENNIEKEVLQIFKDVEEDAEWTGEPTHKSLFCFWRKIKSKMNSSEASHSISGESGVVGETHM
ncbi:uncharacterized protein LOC143900891 [Temnothorax americanus]|uniref:uncharacterized protein LOC143900891 n=1 Tax=Temnothorax americanus TaxID=1964332 RepID=UPI0040689314